MAPSRPSVIVRWLRSDLRRLENPVLEWARQGSAAACFDVPVFILEETLLFPPGNAARRRFLHDSLRCLRAKLRAEDRDLALLSAEGQDPRRDDLRPNGVWRRAAGETATARALSSLFERLRAEMGAAELHLVGVREFAPSEVHIESDVARVCRAHGVELHLLCPGGATTLLGFAELERLGFSAHLPRSFDDFYDAALRQGWFSAGATEGPLALPLAAVVVCPFPAAAATESAWDSLPIMSTGSLFRGGEDAGLRRMQLWLQAFGSKRRFDASGIGSLRSQGTLTEYKTQFRRLHPPRSSLLSPYIALGCISVRRLARDVAAAGALGKHTDHFIYELLWRDFFRWSTLLNWGARLFALRGPDRAPMRAWRPPEEAARLLRRLEDAETGVPFIDALMSQLRQDGHVNNVGRQVLASFVVDELRIDWRLGARLFERHLVDYDVCSNYGQWGRAADVLPCVTQGKRSRERNLRYYDLALYGTGGWRRPNWQIFTEARDFLRTYAGADAFAPWTRAGGQPEFLSRGLREYFESVDRHSDQSSG